MNIEKDVIKMIAQNISINDIVTILSHSINDSKANVRKEVYIAIESNNLELPKKESKSGKLKEWFLSQKDITTLTKEDLYQKCKELEMKGGSIMYYVNSYILVINIFNSLNKNKSSSKK
jgi:hypothetical protein